MAALASVRLLKAQGQGKGQDAQMTSSKTTTARSTSIASASKPARQIKTQTSSASPKVQDRPMTSSERSTVARSSCCQGTASSQSSSGAASSTVLTTAESVAAAEGLSLRGGVGDRGGGAAGVSVVPVRNIPVERAKASFATCEERLIVQMEKRLRKEKHRKEKHWEKACARMKAEFLRLHPVEGGVAGSEGDRDGGAAEGGAAPNDVTDPWVVSRVGNLDVLNIDAMKTVFMDYPDVVGKRFRIRFDIGADIDRKSIRVQADLRRISVTAAGVPDSSKGSDASMSYSRHIAKPSLVDQRYMKAYLTSDGILNIEAPVRPTYVASPSLARIASPALVVSPGSGGGAADGGIRRGSGCSSSGSAGGGREKIGVPIFREEEGMRRLHLLVDVGTSFRPEDVVVEVAKENKLVVWAKRTEKGEGRMSKCKFFKEYELTERIERYSLRGGLQTDGRLVIGAFAKGHGGEGPGPPVPTAATSTLAGIVAAGISGP